MSRRVQIIPPDYPCSAKYYVGPVDDTPWNKDLNWKRRSNLEKHHKMCSGAGVYNPANRHQSVYLPENGRPQSAPSEFGGSSGFSGTSASDTASLGSLSTTSTEHRRRRHKIVASRNKAKKKWAHDNMDPHERLKKLAGSANFADTFVHKYLSTGPETDEGESRESVRSLSSCCSSCCSSVTSTKSKQGWRASRKERSLLKATQLAQLQQTIASKTEALREQADKELAELRLSMQKERERRLEAEQAVSRLQTDVQALRLTLRPASAGPTGGSSGRQILRRIGSNGVLTNKKPDHAWR